MSIDGRCNDEVGEGSDGDEVDGSSMHERLMIASCGG